MSIIVGEMSLISAHSDACYRQNCLTSHTANTLTRLTDWLLHYPALTSGQFCQRSSGSHSSECFGVNRVYASSDTVDSSGHFGGSRGNMHYEVPDFNELLLRKQVLLLDHATEVDRTWNMWKQVYYRVAQKLPHRTKCNFSTIDRDFYTKNFLICTLEFWNN